jgi:hypothetical protein
MPFVPPHPLNILTALRAALADLQQLAKAADMTVGALCGSAPPWMSTTTGRENREVWAALSVKPEHARQTSSQPPGCQAG